jgi:hypothetical protein
MPTGEELREQMIANAAEINRLHARIHESLERREETDARREEWSQACDEFHRRYGELCLPGGWTADLMDRLLAGDKDAVESVLCFLEVRPYFFRSGYHWKMFFKKCRRAPMSGEQAERFADVARRYAEWKAFSHERSLRGVAIRRRLSPIVLHFPRLFPVQLADYHFDGIETVGDLYRMLCRAMKAEGEDPPDKPGGTARRPFKLIAPRHTDMAAWAREYGAWRSSRWPAADIWATLVATIREAYSLEESAVIGPETILCPPEGSEVRRG